MIHPVKKVFITQKFGANPANYAKFGFKGHNGLDYRAFLDNGERCYESGVSKVYAPHSGKVIENAYDADGYGYYVKIENDKEGSVLAHLHGKSSLVVGSNVSEGDYVGAQGTTGNSTGIHLHWGYYTLPRNRANGYGGMIDQEPLLINQGGDMADSEEIKKLKEELAESEKNKKSLQSQVDGWVRDSQNGTWVSRAEHIRAQEIAYDKGFEAGKFSVPTNTSPVDLDKWEVNGLTISTVEGNKTISLNYKQK